MAWNISSWPSFYVLDAKGVIQAKQMTNKMLDLEIERLTKQVEPAPK